MKKADIERRYMRNRWVPTVNVKTYRQAYSWPMTSAIAARLGVSDALAEQASQYAYDSAQEAFWENWKDADELAQYFAEPVEVWQDGRSGGWLIVDGLPELDSWNAVRVAKWAKFQRDVHADIAHRCALDTVCEDIVANRWAEEGAQQYNFRDTPSGVVCMAEVIRAERAAVAQVRAGFGLKP